MIPNRHRFSWYMLFATVLCSVCAATAQQEPPATFVIKISLPESTIHVGDGLAISVIESNPTDHAVKVGEGFNGGIEVEALSEKGEDIGPHVSGSANRKRTPQPNFGPLWLALSPGRKRSFVWPLKPDPKYLIPGTYRVRVHNRDMTTSVDVYSNLIILTVLP